MGGRRVLDLNAFAVLAAAAEWAADRSKLATSSRGAYIGSYTVPMG